MNGSILKATTGSMEITGINSGFYIVKAVLTESEKEKFEPVAKKLNSMGIPLVGLDVIDEKIIEINVTSPCYFIKEINSHFGIELEKKITKFILSQVKSGALVS